MTCLAPMVTLSIRVLPSVRDQLERLADDTGRTKSFLAAEGIENYLIAQAWQIKGIKAAIEKADSQNAKFVDHDKVTAWMKSWGSSNEIEAP